MRFGKIWDGVVGGLTPKGVSYRMDCGSEIGLVGGVGGKLRLA